MEEIEQKTAAPFAEQVAAAMGEPTADQIEAAKDRQVAILEAKPKPSSSPRIASEHLFESPTNPRKRWGDLDELAGSIRAIDGLIHALVVRIEFNPDGTATGRYEIVCGARRFRAGKLAGLTAFACDVRELSDDHALELQLIENVQRSDLHPLEEAEGYANMIAKLHGYTVETIAARVKKSTGWVYGRLKLLELGPEAVSAISRQVNPLELGVAIVLARQPQSRQGEGLRGLERITTGVKDQIAYLQKDFARNLKGAPFDLKDATLPRLGGIGDCVTCPKNSNNEPRELFGDYVRIERAGICSNTTCFVERCDRVVEIKLEKAKATGLEVLTMTQTKKAIVAGAPATGSPYVIATDQMTDDPKRRTWRQFFEEKIEAKEDRPAVTLAPDEQNPGEVIHLYDRKAAVAAAIENGAKWARRQAPTGDAQKAKNKASNDKARLIAETVDQAMPQIVTRWRKTGPALPELRAAAHATIEIAGGEANEQILALAEAFEVRGSVGSWINKAATIRDLGTFIVAALLYPQWQNGADTLEPEFKAIAKSAGVDLAEIGRAQLAAAKADAQPPVKWKKIGGGEEALIDGKIYAVTHNGGGPKAGYFYKGPTGSGAACDSIEAGRLKCLELAGRTPKQVAPKKLGKGVAS